MKLLTALILFLVCQTANAWQWRITERANCANGQCVASPARESSKVEVRSAVRMDGVLLPGASNDCPDGRCPLIIRGKEPSLAATTPSRLPVDNSGLCKQPTLAPPEPKVIVQAKPLRSVMVQPVRRARVFTGRIIQRIFGRR